MNDITHAHTNGAVVLPQGLEWHACGLHIPAETTLDEWLALGSLLTHIDGARMWWIGDWLSFGELCFGQKAAQAYNASKITGIPAETLRGAKYVSERIPIVRRLTDVTWGHHQAVAFLEDPREQARLLRWAAENDKSRSALRAEVRRWKQKKKQDEATAVLAAAGETENIVHIGDALACDWPEQAALVVVDPPYGLSTGGTSGARDGKGAWDEWDYSALHAFNKAWIDKARRALDDTGSLIAFGTLHNTYSIGHLLKQAGAYIIRQIVWTKPFVQKAVNPEALVPAHETIIWARFGARHRCNLFEITRDVWDIPPAAPFGHPTEKPEPLLRRLIEMASDPGDLVLDIFCGAGTTSAAALAATRRAWAVEKDAGWAAVAEARCLSCYALPTES